MTPQDSWTEPGAHHVAQGVHRIPLPLPNDGLRAVNVYAIESGDGLVLIDAGWAIPEARAQLLRSLGLLGAGIGDIRRFLVTHVHRDHYTQAVTVRRETGAELGLGIGDRPSLDLMRRDPQVAMSQQASQLRVMGAGALADAVARWPIDTDTSVWEEPDQWLSDEVLHLPNGRTLEAVETPGHTQGHLVFHDRVAGLLFAGDHILPSITPSVGFEPVRSANPLGTFIRSLERVRSRPDAMLLPAHGPVARSAHDRVDQLIAFHGRRLDELERATTGRGITAFEAAGEIRWTRREHRFEDLDALNAMLATFETAAHLDLLVAQGKLSKDGSHYS